MAKTDKSQTTKADGLHCVYGKCQGVPYISYPCHPGCRFQMSSVSELEMFRRSLDMKEVPHD